MASGSVTDSWSWAERGPGPVSRDRSEPSCPPAPRTMAFTSGTVSTHAASEYPFGCADPFQRGRGDRAWPGRDFASFASMRRRLQIFSQAHRYTGMGAATRAAPGDEGKPSGFSLIPSPAWPGRPGVAGATGLGPVATLPLLPPCVAAFRFLVRPIDIPEWEQ